MRKAVDLFVGVTSWNSATFLQRSIPAIFKNTCGLSLDVCVLDNASDDRSASIAQELGARVIVRHCTQPDALNVLAAEARSEHVLLMHSDVVLLSPQWYSVCAGKLVGDCALVSPEDIGCGPLTRPFGRGMPESSFMLFRRDALMKLREWRWPRRLGVPFPERSLDFNGEHVTHRLPMHLKSRGYSWQQMSVLISPTVSTPSYVPDWAPPVWDPELSNLRYGLGNFYSLDGVVTHYHNWYDRSLLDVSPDSRLTTGKRGQGFPLAYLADYTRNFLSDYDCGQLILPDPSPSLREPRCL